MDGLAFGYGDSADVNGGWVSLERVVQDYWDPDTDPADARRFFLNQIHAAEDAWISHPEWNARYDPDKVVADRETITLGFDGSRRRSRGVTDATALIACRVSDGHLFEPLPLSCGSSPTGPPATTGRSRSPRSRPRCTPCSPATASSGSTPTPRSGSPTSPGGKRSTRPGSR
jgi:hypothetical protein